LRKILSDFAKRNHWKQDGSAKFIHQILSTLADRASEHLDTFTEKSRKDLLTANIPELSKMDAELRLLEYGLNNEKSKERETIFNQVKMRVKNTNGC
jgi:hypothetical protein